MKKEEILFQNRCAYTRPVMLEMYRKAYSTGFVLLLMIFELVFILSALASFVGGKENYASGFMMLIYFAVTVFLHVGLPWVRAGRAVKQAKAVFHGPVTVDVLFSEHELQSRNEVTGAESAVEYGQIVQVSQSKDLYFLKLKSRIFVLLDKKGFEKGSPEEFERFIRKKAENAKILL